MIKVYIFLYLKGGVVYFKTRVDAFDSRHVISV